jgi:hypothetical protein
MRSDESEVSDTAVHPLVAERCRPNQRPSRGGRSVALAVGHHRPGDPRGFVRARDVPWEFSR